MRPPVPLGEFRYQVRFALITDVNAMSGPNVTIDENTETLVHTDRHFDDIGYVYAAIKPIGTQQFYNNVQSQWEFTHRIYIRWINKVWNQNVMIFNDVILKDGSVYTQKYKVIRASDWENRKEYIVLDAWLTDVDVV
jgi:SPP1 family predicted phage head-tail adaptor